MKIKLLYAAALTVLFTAGAFAQGGKAEPNEIKFAPGKSNAVLKGTLANGEEMEYVFDARKGQTVKLAITSLPKGNFFLKLRPFDKNIIFATGQDRFLSLTITLPETGQYMVVVGKRYNAKLRKAKFSFSVAITGP
jgi:hypothetical protein